MPNVESRPPAPRRLIATVDSIDQATHDIRIIRLRILEGGHFEFIPGQYAQLGFNEHEPRDYSMAGRSDGGEVVEFHIRDSQDGGASSYVSEELETGERVTIDGPFGDSYFRADHDGPMIAVAGGSGLAPMKAIVEAALQGGYAYPVWLYFGARKERDIYMESYFRDLEARYGNFRFVPVLSEPDGETERRVGMVTDAISTDLDDLTGVKAYLAGPPPMVEAAVSLFQARGLAKADVHADAFYSEAEKQAGAGIE